MKKSHIDTEALTAFIQDLIRIKSLSGNEEEVARRIITEMHALGYDEVSVDAYGNVLGKIRGNSSRSILFEGHMDIVDVPNPERWSYDPFDGTVHRGCLYGRGASDMKAALAAMIHGAAGCREDADHGDIYVAAVVYEEIFEGVGFGKVLDRITPDAVVLGEPNDLEIAIGQKGRAEIVVETAGINAHSAHPEHGVNAIDTMVTLLHQLQKLPVVESDVLGKGIVVATDMISTPYPGTSIIPNRCRATLDRRLIEDETRESVLKPLIDTIEYLQAADSTFQTQVSYAVEELPTYTGERLRSERFYPGWSLSGSDPLVSLALAAYRELGIEPVLSSYQFCTDGSESAGKRHIPTIGIGPGKASMAHVVNECVELEKVFLAADIYFTLAKRFK